MMNWKSFVAALLILALGMVVTGILAMRDYADLAFWFTATKQPVTVERVLIRQERVTDPAAAAHIATLRALEGRTVDGYLSPHAPHHFALTHEFPWSRLGALALVLLVLVLPSGIAIGVHVRERLAQGRRSARS